MKRYYFFTLCTILGIQTSFATVYDGAYSSDITVNSNSVVENNSSFTNSNIYIKTDKTLSIGNNVQFTNSSITPSATAFTYGYYLNLDGDNISFVNSNRAIVAGLPNWTYPTSTDVGNINIKINGDNLLFNNNGVLGQKGGAIYIGVPTSVYYRHHIGQQFLTINGTNTIFSNNKAHSGGAIYNGSANVKFNNSASFNNNSAQYGGGGNLQPTIPLYHLCVY